MTAPHHAGINSYIAAAVPVLQRLREKIRRIAKAAAPAASAAAKSLRSQRSAFRMMSGPVKPGRIERHRPVRKMAACTYIL